MARGREKAAVQTAPVEGPWELPEGWRWERLSNLADYISRGRGPKYVEANGVPVLNQRCIRWHGIELQHARLTSTEAAAKLADEQWLRAGDILWNSTGTGTIGRAAIVPQQLARGRYLVDSHVTIVRPSKVGSRWLCYWIATNFIQSKVAGTGSTNQVELNRSTANETLVPVPPLETQRRIVARIDELFSELDDGEKALVRAREDLEVYRKALLKAAVTGELTADWRAANPPTETGEQFLKRILAERRARWEADPKNKGKRYKEPAAPDTSGLSELPEGWAWMTVAQLTYCGPSNGYSPPRSKTEGGVPALKLTATTSGKMRLDNDCIKLVNAEIDPNSDLFLQPGDVVFQRGNTREYVGIAAVYNGPSSTYIYPDLMIRVRPVSPMLGNWIWKYANSPFGRRYMMENAKGASGTMPKITGEVIRSFAVPVPPMNELEELLSRIEAGEGQHTELTDALQTSDPLHFQLRQSILAAAFKGELVQ